MPKELEPIGIRPSFDGLGLAKRTRAALEDMAQCGLSVNAAADRHGIRRSNLRRAFDLPHVRERFNAIVADVRANAGQQAYLRLVRLSEDADSEHVRADCAKWVAGVDGMAPVRRVDGRFSHNHSFGGFVYDDAPIDVTPARD